MSPSRETITKVPDLSYIQTVDPTIYPLSTLTEDILIYTVIHSMVCYKNLLAREFFSTSGCRCTLGIKPKPIALRMAFAIFL